MAAPAHRSNSEFVRILDDIRFQFRQLLMRVDVVRRPEQLQLRRFVATGSVTAHTHAQVPGRTALSLRLVDRVHDAFPHAIEVAVGPPQAFQRLRQRVLDIPVLAAAPLQQQLDLDGVLAVLVKVNHRSSRPQVVARVLACERIDRVLPELARLGRSGDRLQNLLFQHELVEADGRLDDEGRHARVLTDRPLALAGHVHVQGNCREGECGPGLGGFPRLGTSDQPTNVRGQIRGGLDNQVVEA